MTKQRKVSLSQDLTMIFGLAFIVFGFWFIFSTISAGNSTFPKQPDIIIDSDEYSMIDYGMTKEQVASTIGGWDESGKQIDYDNHLEKYGFAFKRPDVARAGWVVLTFKDGKLFMKSYPPK